MKKYGGVEAELHAFLISALDGGVLSVSRPGRFTPKGKGPRYPLDRRLSGHQSLWRRENIPSPVGNRTPVVQPVV
jgi:hypothetical protein